MQKKIFVQTLNAECKHCKASKLQLIHINTQFFYFFFLPHRNCLFIIYLYKFETLFQRWRSCLCYENFVIISQIISVQITWKASLGLRFSPFSQIFSHDVLRIFQSYNSRVQLLLWYQKVDADIHNLCI